MPLWASLLILAGFVGLFILAAFRLAGQADDTSGDFARNLADRDETWVPLAGRRPEKMPRHSRSDT
jgi:hypothetical protein